MYQDRSIVFALLGDLWELTFTCHFINSSVLNDVTFFSFSLWICKWQKRGKDTHPVNKIQEEKSNKQATWKAQVWLIGRPFSWLPWKNSASIRINYLWWWTDFLFDEQPSNHSYFLIMSDSVVKSICKYLTDTGILCLVFVKRDFYSLLQFKNKICLILTVTKLFKRPACLLVKL